MLFVYDYCIAILLLICGDRLLRFGYLYRNVDDQNVSRQRPVKNLQSRKCKQQ
jgi:hypothetical protein